MALRFARRHATSLPTLHTHLRPRFSSTLLSASSHPPPNPDLPPSTLSDHEWDLRTGRAIDHLRTTLPQFFSTGLISHPRPVFNHASRLDALVEDSSESIYSPRIRLSYTPPTALPAPFPRTLHIEGLPLYFASSVFIRHTMNAIYTDLAVSLRSFQIHPSSKATSGTRERSVMIGFGITGRARVGGGQGEWVVTSTYSFHPSTALIHLHIVDSILPAPHDAVFDVLRAALGSLGGGPRPAGAAPGEGCLNLKGR